MLRSTYTSCRLLRTTQMWSWTPRTNALALRTSFGHGTPMLPDYLLYVHIICSIFFKYIYIILYYYIITILYIYCIICIYSYIIYNYDCYYFTFYAHWRLETIVYHVVALNDPCRDFPFGPLLRQRELHVWCQMQLQAAEGANHDQ